MVRFFCSWNTSTNASHGETHFVKIRTEHSARICKNFYHFLIFSKASQTAAGKAAHLGGVVAAYTPLPVIAVPMKTSDLGGLDSLLSMVQMPSGVPVACVAINGSKNAAILAVQMIGTGDEAARAKIAAFKESMANA